jgi:hypothetical protein
MWYSISRTVSDDDAHRGGMMIARFAVKPRAYGAPQKRALGLDRSARPSNFGDRAANVLTTHVPVNHRTRVSDNVREVECWFSHLIRVVES